ncbi:hypothetical protein E0Z10_g1505 [Xylaria hypoxylon]|uniref:Uncharacterized protein n=1 Tax=Xylaria hypoxylon TaxID=37992 RepID=A0A4Z0ZCE1_9PEZI|nr:hypothetical protein E0Z10_g1505 [Xylaria hypoxylon]
MSNAPTQNPHTGEIPAASATSSLALHRGSPETEHPVPKVEEDEAPSNVPMTVLDSKEARHDSSLHEITKFLKNAGFHDYEIISTCYLEPMEHRQHKFQITTKVKVSLEVRRKICDAVKAKLGDERERIVFLVGRDSFIEYTPRRK